MTLHFDPPTLEQRIEREISYAHNAGNRALVAALRAKLERLRAAGCLGDGRGVKCSTILE